MKEFQDEIPVDSRIDKPIGRCPQDIELNQLLAGQLEPKLENEIEAHISVCANCSQRLGEFSELGDDVRIDQLLKVYRNRNSPVACAKLDTPTSRNTVTEFSDGEVGSTAKVNPLPTLPGYEIHEEIARGGMGVVFRATDVDLGRPVAVKMILSGLLAGPERISRFVAEARTIAKLDHPNIVKVFDVGDFRGQPFFVMELIRGKSLQRMVDGTPWTSERAVQLVTQLAKAIHVAHQNDVVHRDLKPANILISISEDETDFPHIVDFGLAKNFDADELTLTGEALGTPSYMSPEQASGRNDLVGPASDTYSIGCILYELLTGRPPFLAASIAETLKQIIADEPAVPRSLNATVPADLETICLKCLQKEPDRRYASSLEMANDLERFRAGRPIKARRTPWWERGVKWCGRHPTVTALGLVSAVAMLVLLGMWIKFTADLADQTAISVRESRKAKQNEQLAKSSEAEAKTSEREANANALKAELSAELQIEGMSFLNDMTYELSTLGSQDKLFEALQASEEKIKPRLTNRPLPMAAYLLAMGNTLGQIGKHEHALDIISRAEAIFENYVGSNSKNTTRARILKLGLLINLGKSAEARGLIEQLETDGVEFFRYDKRKLRLLAANLNCNEGEYDSAVNDMTEFINFISNQKESNLEYFMEAHGILGVALSQQRRFEEACRHFKLRLDYTRQNYPDGHYAILWAENTYGVYLANTGKPDEAIELLGTSLKHSTEKLGAQHKNTIELMQNLASAMSRAKRYDEAESLYKKAIEWDLEQFGQANPLTMGAMINLAVDYLDRKKFDEGFAFLEQNCVVDELASHPNNYAGRLVVYYTKICLGSSNWERAEELLTVLDELVDEIENSDPYLVGYQEAGPKRLLKLRAEAEAGKAFETGEKQVPMD